MIKNKITPYIPAISHCLTDTAQGSIAALLPFFISTMGLSYYQAASLMFAHTVIASVAQPFFGYLADKVKIPIFIPLGLFLATSSIGAMGFVNTYQWLFALALISGTGSAIFHPESALLVKQTAGSAQGKGMGLFAVGGNGGFAIGPIIASGVYIWSASYLAIYILIGIIGVILFQSIVGFTSVKQQTHDTSTNSDTSIGKNSLPTSSPFRNDWFSFSKLCFVIAARSTCFTVLNTFIPIYWITCLFQSAQSANIALTIFFSIGTVLTFFGGTIADKLGFVRVIRYSHVLLVPALYAFINSNYLLGSYLLMIPVAAGIFGQYGPIVVLGQNYLKKNIGFASGITLGLGVTFGGLIAPLVGSIADTQGIQAALQLLLPITMIAGIISFFLKEPSLNQ